MKKCNFLAVLVTALFMFLGLAANAQYLPSTKASYLVASTVEGLKKNPPVAGQTAHTTAASVAANRVHSLKIKVGEALILPLKEGRSVDDAIVSVMSTLNPGNVAERKVAMQEVEAFYKNLLKKSFN